MITVQLNGQPRSLPEGATLADLIALLDASPGALATAVNGDFVPRAARGGLALTEGDSIMTFQPITGG